MQKLPTHVHIIGISGVATSALAIAFKKAGVIVTGSDKGFFPPASTELEKAGIPFYAGWHPEKMVEDGVPDLVVMGGGGTSPSNPEVMFAREKELPVLSFAETLGKYLIKEHSIVCTGTWGKSSTSAFLSHILEIAGMDSSYFTGGISIGRPSAAFGSSDWSVVEGDEYQTSISDKQPKFAYYKPTHLLLTKVSWDHADLYPTEASYFEAFKKLVADVPDSGMIVASKGQGGIAQTLAGSTKNIVWYGADDADYMYQNVQQSQNGLQFEIVHKGTTFQINSPMLGAFQAENITGCFAMAHSIGIAPEKIIVAIGSFMGLKRRLEKRLDGATAKSGVTVFDDIAHSPEKAASVLKELRRIYPGRITAVFEPNIGGREHDAAAKYDWAFKIADTVIIPRLTKLKVAEDKAVPMEGDELAHLISKTHKDTRYIEDDARLIETLVSEAKKGDVIAFLGSHGFRGMIEAVTEKLG